MKKPSLAALEASQRSLRSRILLPYLLLALVIVAVTMYVTFYYATSLMRQGVYNQLQMNAGTVQELLVQEYKAQDHLWHTIAASPIANSTNQELEQQLELLLQTHSTDILLLQDPSGTAIFNWDQLPSTGLSVVRPSPQLIGTNSGPITYIEPATKEAVIYTTGQIKDAETQLTAGILTIGQSLQQLVQKVAASTGTDLTLCLDNGTIIANTLPATIPISLPLDPFPVLNKEATKQPILIADEQIAYNQSWILLPAGTLLPDNLFLGVSLPDLPLSSANQRIQYAILVVIILAILVPLLVGYRYADNFVRPIRTLMDAAQQIAMGNLKIRVKAQSMDELGQLADSFNQMVIHLDQRQNIEDLFGRYVGNNIAQRILQGEGALGGRVIWATALFADIRDFSSFTQRSDDLELFLDELNEYYSSMQKVVDEHEGVINKFGGDSILAIFGAPISTKCHAEQAVQAALAMMDELWHLNKRRQQRGAFPIRIGIGVNTGEMIVGNLGSEKRREYTVLGECVNLAKRFSDLNKENPFASVFIGEVTLAAILDVNSHWQIDPLGPVKIKGWVEPTHIFSVAQKAL